MRCACGRTISANKLACQKCSEVNPAKGGGVLEVLNVQGGDVKITFDPANPSETIRAKRMIEDMLRRGYALVVEVERDGKTAYERVQSFDAARGEYIIADFDSLQAAKADAASTADEQTTEAIEAADRPRRGKNSHKIRSMAMETSKATAIGRSAGG